MPVSWVSSVLRGNTYLGNFLALGYNELFETTFGISGASSSLGGTVKQRLQAAFRCQFILERDTHHGARQLVQRVFRLEQARHHALARMLIQVSNPLLVALLDIV